MVDLTPPSSSANTPKREMDVDEHEEHDLERRYSSGSDEGEPGASDTELDDTEPIETGQATPPLVEGEAGPSTATVSEPAFASFNLVCPPAGQEPGLIKNGTRSCTCS